MNPLIVGLTQGTGATAGAIALHTAAAAAGAAVAFARKKTPLLARTENDPFAPVTTRAMRLSLFARGPPKTTTAAPARG